MSWSVSVKATTIASSVSQWMLRLLLEVYLNESYDYELKFISVKATAFACLSQWKLRLLLEVYLNESYVYNMKIVIVI